MAEWTNAVVLKTAVGQPTVGSNPTPSARGFLLECRSITDGLHSARRCRAVDRFGVYRLTPYSQWESR